MSPINPQVRIPIPTIPAQIGSPPESNDEELGVISHLEATSLSERNSVNILDYQLEIILYILGCITDLKDIFNIMLVNRALSTYVKDNILKDAGSHGINAQTKWSAKKIDHIFNNHTIDRINGQFGRIKENINRNLIEEKIFKPLNTALENIRHVSFKCDDYSKREEYKFLFEFISKEKDKENEIKTLEISIFGHHTLYSLDEMIEALGRLPKSCKIFLEFINFGLCSLDILKMFEILNKNIHKLFIINNFLLGTSDIIELSPHLNNTSISSLVLDDVNMTNKGLASLNGNLPANLYMISLAGNKLDDDAIFIIGEILRKNTQKLNLSGNFITNEGVINLLNILQNMAVRKLFLRENRIKMNSIGKFIEPLKNTQLNTLDLQGNGTLKMIPSDSSEYRRDKAGVITKFQNRYQEDVSVLRKSKEDRRIPCSILKCEE